MKKKMIVGVVAASLLGFGCQPSSTPPASTSSPAAQATTAATTAPDATATPETTGTPEAAQGGLPYQFPSNPPAAEPGTFVFVPMASSLERLTSGSQKKADDFRPRELVKTGPETSTIKDREEYEAPNSLIFPCQPDAKVAVGDIVLGNPQYGSMEVAIVTDAADPTKPTVHFFKPVYGGAKPEGDQFAGQLEAGKFRVFSSELDPGSRALYPEGEEKGYGLVIKTEGDRVLLEKFGGELAAFDKSEVTPLPVKPGVKAGDKVQAPFGKGMDPATVTKVDEKIGRVSVTFDGRESQGESVFCFTQILPGQ